MTRLNLLRLNTAPALDFKLLADTAALAQLDNAQLRELGRFPFPCVRRRGEPGFARVSWDEALRRLGGHIRAKDPRRLTFFITARGVTNEVYYMAQKAARFLGTNHVDNAARLCHAPSRPWPANSRASFTYALITTRQPYRPDLHEATGELRRSLARLKARAKDLGFQLVPTPASS